MNESSAWTIGRILGWSAEFLKDRSDSPRLDAELLLAHALGFARIQLYTQFDKPLTTAEREPFKGYLKRRGGGEPVAYITGTKEFMGYQFHVSPAVLIPRPDTEVLVESVLAAAKGRDSAVAVLDVGTGSGCVAVSLALKLAGSRVSGWDLAEDALALAAANAARLGADVDFVRVDALAAESWAAGATAGLVTFDVIVSNPPYISPAEVPDLPRSVIGFEPRGALIAAPDGLAFYRALARLAPHRLAAGGRLALEIGSGQAEAVSAILRDHGWQAVSVLKDYARLDRVISAERPA